MNRTNNGSASKLFCTGCEVILTSASKCVGRGATCRICENKRKREERKRRQIIFQLRLLKHLGGKCEGCQKEATISNMVCFDFHHVDKETKRDRVSNMLAASRPYSIILEEANKCILFCACCHRLHHQKYGY